MTAVPFVLALFAIPGQCVTTFPESAVPAPQRIGGGVARHVVMSHLAPRTGPLLAVAIGSLHWNERVN